MPSEDYGKDASMVVDEALLASVRGQTSHDPRQPIESREPPAADVGAGGGARETPTIEGYGALREIGRGGFSTVYEALQFEFERWVAVKVLDEAITDDEAVADFERECRAMGGLSSHPNIVTVFSSEFTSDRRPCIVMELFPHGNYLNILQRSGPLGLEQLLPVSVRVAGALATAHNRGIVHGDVKPQNIFRSQYELAALGDFGIATLIAHRWSDQRTRMSLYYAAPELIERGAAATSPFADQYSLAATMYTLCTGLRPYEGDGSESTRELLVRTLNEPPPRLSADFPAAFGDLLHKAMSRRLRDRFRDLGEFAGVLVDIEAQLGLSPTDIRIGADAGRYIGGVADASGPMSRSAERSSEPSRDRSSDRAVASGPREAAADDQASGQGSGAARPGGRQAQAADASRTGEPTEGPLGPDMTEVPVEETVVRPQRPAVPVTAGSSEPSSRQSQEKSRRSLWIKIGSAVAVALAAAAVIVLVARGGNDAGPDEEDAAASETDASEEAGAAGVAEPADDQGSQVAGTATPETDAGEEAVGAGVAGADESRPGSGGSGGEDGVAVVEEESGGSGGEDGVAVVEEESGGSGGEDGVAVVEEESGGSGGEDGVAVVEEESGGSGGEDGAAVVEEESGGSGGEDGAAVVEEESGGPYRVAFVSRFLDTYSIFYIDFIIKENIESEDPQLIVSSEQELGHPSFSPDGSWIAFSKRSVANSDSSNRGTWEIFVRNIDTKQELQIVCQDNTDTIEVEGTDEPVRVPNNGSSPSWSRDGKLIVFSHGRAGNDIWTVNVETGEYSRVKDVPGKDDAFPSLSPDGSSVVFARTNHPVKENSLRGIWILNYETTNVPVWLTDDDHPTGDYRNPDWAPDGGSIAYSFGRPDYTFGSRKLLYRHIGVTDVQGNIGPSLTEGEVVDADPSWSTDGRLIAFARSEVDDDEEQYGDIYVLEAGRDDQPHQVFVDSQIDSGDPSLILISASGTDVAVSPTFNCGAS